MSLVNPKSSGEFVEDFRFDIATRVWWVTGDIQPSAIPSQPVDLPQAFEYIKNDQELFWEKVLDAEANPSGVRPALRHNAMSWAGTAAIGVILHPDNYVSEDPFSAQSRELAIDTVLGRLKLAFPLPMEEWDGRPSRDLLHADYADTPFAKGLKVVRDAFDRISRPDATELGRKVASNEVVDAGIEQARIALGCLQQFSGLELTDRPLQVPEPQEA